MKKTLTVKIEVETDNSGYDDYRMKRSIEKQLMEIANTVSKGGLDDGDSGYESSGVLQEDGIQQQYWFTITEQ